MEHEMDFKMGVLVVPGEVASPLPLKRTTVTGQITGAVASITVTQHFGNPSPAPIDLEYLFPLPHEAAVVDYQITIGERIIKAEIKEAQAARQKYLEAVSQGQRASLLEQRRPNLFSIQIGNVQPGETIITELHYDERLKYRDGEYEFVFPLGITPRYHRPGTTVEEARGVSAPVTLDETDVAPIEITLSLLPGLPIEPPVSRSHPIQVTPRGQDFDLCLAERTIPNKDFVLRYKVSADLVRTAWWSSLDGDLETALILLLPPRFDAALQPAAREFIFVIDRSGSMQGKPIEQAKNALRACIRALNESDTFTIQAFDNEIEWFNPRTLPITQDNVTAADRWLDEVRGRGGTEIVPAIEAALKLSADSDRVRFVVFLTDGAVSAEEDSLRQINRHRGKARVFSFGIGPSVNRYLLAKMAQMGRGTAEFLGLNDDIEAAITRFQDRVSYPALQDIRLEWQGAESWDTYPDVLPDLYIGEPLEIVTRLKRPARGSKAATLKLSGTLQGKKLEMKMDLPPAVEARPALRRLWARARIEALLGQEPSLSEKAREQIIALSLEHRVMTVYTSFVAVDSEITSRRDDTQRVKVAVPLPEGLDFSGFGDVDSFAAPMRGMAAQSYALPPQTLGAPRALSAPDLPAFLRRRSAASAPAAARLSAPPPPEPAAPELKTVEDRLKWLARTQNVDGSWESAEMTAAALLAFVRAGHTTREGNYRRQVDKAARWLRDHLDGLHGFDRFVAVRALDELHTLSGDYPVEDWRAKLPVPKTDVERAARGFSPDRVPDHVESLDDLRMVALLRGGITAITLKKEPLGPLVQAWLAVGKAPQP